MLLDDTWLSRLANYKRLFIGYSGGLDSTVLVHYLAQIPALRDKLTAVHVHHGLSVNADTWETHCAAFCSKLDILFIVHHVTIDGAANLEERARDARHQVFSSLLSEHDCLLLAHHADDQAETLLLNLFRGAGIDGLSAMPAMKLLASGILFRPFLQLSKQTLEMYAHAQALQWIEDESNLQLVFSRNYVRHRVMPLLRKKWPGVVGNLVSSATHCQQAKQNLNTLAEIDIDGLATMGNTLSLIDLPIDDQGRLSNILRVWLANNQVKMPSATVLTHLINNVIFAKPDATPSIRWGQVVVNRYQQTLYLLPSSECQCPATLPKVIPWTTFPADLYFGEEGRYLKAVPSTNGLHVPQGSQVTVRFRQGGESLHSHGQTQSLKKLLQQWRVPPWQRDKLPLIFIDDVLVAVLEAGSTKMLGCSSVLGQGPTYALFFG